MSIYDFACKTCDGQGRKYRGVLLCEICEGSGVQPEDPSKVKWIDLWDRYTLTLYNNSYLITKVEGKEGWFLEGTFMGKSIYDAKKAAIRLIRGRLEDQIYQAKMCLEMLP